jgi:hypothetical protein
VSRPQTRLHPRASCESLDSISAAFELSGNVRQRRRRRSSTASDPSSSLRRNQGIHRDPTELLRVPSRPIRAPASSSPNDRSDSAALSLDSARYPFRIDRSRKPHKTELPFSDRTSDKTRHPDRRVAAAHIAAHCESKRRRTAAPPGPPQRSASKRNTTG